MSVTLIAYPLNSSNVEVPYVLDTSAEIDVALTFSAEDYSDLTKRRGAFSKTIVLPNTANNAKCFEFAFNVQSFVGGFQATKKIRAALWSDGVQVFSGVMRLLSMSKIASVVTYEVALFAEDVGLFKSIEGKLLSATAGVSGMNHNVSSGHVSATWSNGSVSGYVYGALDNFGYTDAIRFLYVFREWISQNTSGVILVSIRDSEKELPIEKRKGQTIFEKFFNPIGSLYNNWDMLQDISNDNIVEYAAGWFNGHLEVVNFAYVPQSKNWEELKKRNLSHKEIQKKEQILIYQKRAYQILPV